MKPIRPLVQDQDMVVVDPATMVTQAARLMSERQIGAVPVVDGERLAGIFTERDVLSRIVAAGLDPATTTVGSVMSTNLIVADIAEGHEVCMRRMQQGRVRHLLVLESDRLMGILSLRDLLDVEITERDQAINMLNEYVHYIPADFSATRPTRT